MGKTLDVEEFLSWLNETEEELKGERADELNPDRKDEGILLATENVRKYVEKMCKIDEAEGKADQSWIPCSERFPDDDRYILVSFENSTMPDIARYEENDEGGTFYPGDDEKSYSSYGLFVNAWMPLPELYRREDEQDHETD